MAEIPFASLSAGERMDALETAARVAPRNAYLLEKDIWVVQTLEILFDAPFASTLVFKGGTSLSKAWNAIERFSEDVDVTCDIRAIASDLLAGSGPEALPPTRRQEQEWSRAIRARLSAWVQDEATPLIAGGIAQCGGNARVSTSGDRVLVDYAPLFAECGFVRPQVIVEFGARSTGEPHEARRVRCDAAPFLSDITFPEARPQVMLAEWTFWEKATAMHVFSKRGRGRGERLVRHWHDLVRLDEAGIADRALANTALALRVARRKAIFFREKDVAGNRISYKAAVTGGLQLVPTEAARETLAADHAAMLRSGMLPDDGESFDALMKACTDLQEKANRR